MVYLLLHCYFITITITIFPKYKDLLSKQPLDTV